MTQMISSREQVEYIGGLPIRSTVFTFKQPEGPPPPDEICGVKLTDEEKRRWTQGEAERRHLCAVIHMRPKAIQNKLRYLWDELSARVEPLWDRSYFEKVNQRETLDALAADALRESDVSLICAIHFALDMDDAPSLRRLLNEAQRRDLSVYAYHMSGFRNLVVDAVVRRQRACLEELCRARRDSDGHPIVVLRPHSIDHQPLFTAMVHVAEHHEGMWDMLYVLWRGDILEQEERENFMFGIHTRDALIGVLRMQTDDEFADMLLEEYDDDGQCVQHLMTLPDLEENIACARSLRRLNA